MALSGNPKKLAQNISEGYFSLSPPLLKQYVPTDFKTLLTHLAIVARELRGRQIPLEDILALKTRNTRLTRLNQAETLLRAHCKKLRIPV